MRQKPIGEGRHGLSTDREMQPLQTTHEVPIIIDRKFVDSKPCIILGSSCAIVSAIVLSVGVTLISVRSKMLGSILTIMGLMGCLNVLVVWSQLKMGN